MGGRRRGRDVSETAIINVDHILLGVMLCIIWQLMWPLTRRVIAAIVLLWLGFWIRVGVIE